MNYDKSKRFEVISRSFEAIRGLKLKVLPLSCNLFIEVSCANERRIVLSDHRLSNKIVKKHFVFALYEIGCLGFSSSCSTTTSTSKLDIGSLEYLDLPVFDQINYNLLRLAVLRRSQSHP